jgi:hypothetical protein
MMAGLSAGSGHAEPVYLVMPHAGITRYDTKDHTAPLPPPDTVLKAGNITFNITYLDTTGGFNAPVLGATRRAKFEEVLATVNHTLNETGTVDIRVEVSQTDGSGFLASAGTFYSAAPGFQRGSTLQRIRTGIKPFPTFPEMSVVVDFGFDYFYGAGTPSVSQVDFKSVILHEITHGLGFISLAGSNGNSTISPGVYSNFDAFICRRSDEFNLFGGIPPAFQGETANLTSNALAFKGSTATLLYAQGVLPGIYAPSPFNAGSSLSHWDTGNITGGAVMEHLILSGTKRRNYAPVDIGALVDIGWTSAAFFDDSGATHSADQNTDNLISLSELLRVIQLFNSGGYACAQPPDATEDGYTPGSGDQSCTAHSSDYNPRDFTIGLSEILRLIQFYNSSGYHACPGEGTEDGYCLGLP